MNGEKQQCLLGYLGYYRLRRRDGTLAVDNIPGPALRGAIRSFQNQAGLETDGIWGPRTEAAVLKAISEPPASPGAPAWFSRYPHVSYEDWACRCGGRYCSGYVVEPREETVAMLEQFALHFGKPIAAHSGLRCPGHNASIPGASPRSKHCLGMAFDFHMEGVSPEELAAFGETLVPDSGGIGIYPWGIHLDCRETKGRWRG